MKIAQENITTFNNQLEIIRSHFSHEIHGSLNDGYLKRVDNNIMWLRPVSHEVSKMVEDAARKYLIPLVPTNISLPKKVSLDALAIDTRNYKFNRDEANER